MGKNIFNSMVKKNMDLDKHLKNYTSEKGSVEERFMTKATIELAKELCAKKNVLLLGLGNAQLAQEISKIAINVDILEGSEAIIREFKFNSKNSSIHHTYFEKFQTEKKFDIILANHVLEHVDDPVSILRDHCSRWLSKNGLIFVTVPNANSMHRRIGKEMGLLETVYSLNQSDYNAGHQRVYDIEKLLNDIKLSGLKVKKLGGYNIKLVSLNQMSDWSQELLNAIFEISKTIPPEMCSNIWAILKK
jgi:2-polyprenyl-3-methyl-5-hydroxy-6-metoxy-1,4-benzoquinol methylase